MSSGGYRMVSGGVFALIAILQALRAALQVPIQIGSAAIPVGVSWIAVVVAGALAVWAFRGSREA
jgi:hypothetical protein